jgi:hypothetical protein
MLLLIRPTDNFGGHPLRLYWIIAKPKRLCHSDICSDTMSTGGAQFRLKLKRLSETLQTGTKFSPVQMGNAHTQMR